MNKKQIKLAIKARGNIFGEDDAILGRNHFVTVRCLTTKGSLYCIKAAEFLRKFKEVESIWLGVSK